MNVNFTVEPTYVLGPALAVLAAVVALRARQSRPGWTGRHAALRLTAGLYAAAVLSITVFPITATWGMYANQTPWYEQINFIPLLTLDVTAVPNVIMMIPLGFLLPLLTRVTGARRVTAATALASLSIEAAQLLSYVVFNNGRSCDINDLLVNALGGTIGYALLAAALKSASLAPFVRSVALPGTGAAGRPAVAVAGA